jgi:hypothetical protein
MYRYISNGAEVTVQVDYNGNKIALAALAGMTTDELASIGVELVSDVQTKDEINAGINEQIAGLQSQIDYLRTTLTP